MQIEEKEYFILPDIDKKLDESIHDAIAFFNKQCPYCDSLLFSGHIRNKIHIDHFIPIAKGGQNVPWNILPVCQKCNSKKSAKSPRLFLSEEKIELCENYLKSIEDKYINQLQIDLEKYQRIKVIISSFSNPNYQFNSNELIEGFKEIYQIIEGKVLETKDQYSQINKPSIYQKILNLKEKEIKPSRLVSSNWAKDTKEAIKIFEEMEKMGFGSKEKGKRGSFIFKRKGN